MRTIGTILLVVGWLLGVVLVCIPLVYALQSGAFITTMGSTWFICVAGIVSFVVLIELGKHLRNKKANNARE